MVTDFPGHCRAEHQMFVAEDVTIIEGDIVCPREDCFVILPDDRRCPGCGTAWEVRKVFAIMRPKGESVTATADGGATR